MTPQYISISTLGKLELNKPLFSVIVKLRSRSISGQYKFSILSSPGPKPLALNRKPRGLRLTLKCLRPPPPPTRLITLEHEGGVPQQNSMSKNILEWSPTCPAKQISGWQHTNKWIESAFQCLRIWRLFISKNSEALSEPDSDTVQAGLPTQLEFC